MTEEKEDTGTQKGLKPAQVVASALAAVTAAFLGSTLGVAGTVVGAGLASVITTVGSEVYLRSLRKTQEAARRTKGVLVQTADIRVRQETRRIEPPPGRPVNPSVNRLPHPPANPRVNPLLRPNDPRLPSGEAPTVRLPLPGRLQPPVRPPSAEPTVVVERWESAAPKPKGPWWKSRWALVAALSASAFIVGLLVLTGFETVSGHTLSGNPGTTLGRIGGGGGNAPTETPAPSSPSRTRTVTETPSSSPESAPQQTTSRDDSDSSSTPTTTPSRTTTSRSAPSSESPTSSPSAAPTSPLAGPPRRPAG